MVLAFNEEDIVRYCTRCLICARERGSARRIKPPLQPITVESEPFVQIGIAVMKLPKTKGGNDRVLGVVDYFSGYLMFAAIPNEKAETIARVLVERVFNIFGAPKFIV